MDEIRIKGLKIFGHHGVFEEEKRKGQQFVVDITFETDTRHPGVTDELTDTIHYGEASEYVNEIFDEDKFDLIEAAAENIAKKLLIKYPMASSVMVELHKPEAPIPVSFEDVSIKIKRSRHTAFIAVGSNLGDSEAIIERGKAALFASPDVVLIKESPLIKTKPYGVTDQPDFVNGMWKISTLLTPFELLEKLHEVEAGEKRERLIHWGPRTLDLDIIYYDDAIIDSEELIIPHADMTNRQFVLEPLMNVDPFVRHPINGMKAEEMLKLIQ